MLKVWSEFNWKQGAPRVAADLVTVQLAALLALVGAVLTSPFWDRLSGKRNPDSF